jgi:hypothetical protein
MESEASLEKRLKERICAQGDVLAIFTDQRPRSYMPFAINLQDEQNRLGCIRLSSLHNPEHHPEILRDLKNLVRPEVIRWLKIRAIEDFPNLFSETMDAYKDQAPFTKLLHFLDEATMQAALKENEACGDNNRARARLISSLFYINAMDDPGIPIETIFESFASALPAYMRGNRFFVGVIDGVEPITVAIVEHLERQMGTPDSFAQGLLNEILQKKESFPPPDVATAAHIEDQKNAFIQNYMKMPPYLRTLFLEQDCRVMLARSHNAYDVYPETPALLQKRKPLVARGLSSHNRREVAFRHESAGDFYYTVEEEIMHAIDSQLFSGKTPRQTTFTEQPEWRKAMGRQMFTIMHRKAARKVIGQYNIHTQKGNKFENCAELLVDIAHMEHIVSAEMRTKGNLTAIGFKADDTVESAMTAAFKDLYLLYRKTPDGKQLWQKESGEVVVAGKEDVVEGTVKVKSFQDRCLEKIHALTGEYMQIDANPLPTSTEIFPYTPPPPKVKRAGAKR